MEMQTRRIQVHPYPSLPPPAINSLLVLSTLITLIVSPGGVAGQLFHTPMSSTATFSNSYTEAQLILPMPPTQPNVDPGSQYLAQTTNINAQYHQGQSTNAIGNVIQYGHTPTQSNVPTPSPTVTLTPADRRVYLRRKPVGVEVPVLPIKQSVALFSGLTGHIIAFAQEIVELVIGSIGLFLYVLYCIVTVPFTVITNSFYGAEKRALLN